MVPAGGNDIVYTPKVLAAKIVDHFSIPKGASKLEPCRGAGAFWKALGPKCDWCEITEGRDFLALDPIRVHYDYIVTNPPWSKFRVFLEKSFQVSDNVIFLCLINACFMKARLRLLDKYNFGICEILRVVEPKDASWPRTGFELGVIHYKRGYLGPIKFGRLL